jgi:hypothetical protein
MIRAALFALVLTSGGAFAQALAPVLQPDISPFQPLDPAAEPEVLPEPEPEPEPQRYYASAPGAVLRGLDRISGAATDLALRAGESVQYARLRLTLAECRYPADDPSSNAYARLSIINTLTERTLFSGWMIADSPALSALDDPRYDVWVIRCKIN